MGVYFNYPADRSSKPLAENAKSLVKKRLKNGARVDTLQLEANEAWRIAQDEEERKWWRAILTAIMAQRQAGVF